jgi:parallel beta-helix repeat protein
MNRIKLLVYSIILLYISAVSAQAALQYDVNGNRKVDSGDLAIIRQHYNEVTSPPYPAYDVKADGVVDIHDAALVGQNIGEVETGNISSASNLLANPGFESGTTTPLNWTLVTNNGSTPLWDANVSHTGARSIKIQVTGTQDNKSGYPRSDLIKLLPNTTYNFSAWGMTEGAGGTYAPAVRIVEMDAGYNLLRETALVFDKGTNIWGQKSIIINTASNTRYAYVYANIWNGYGTFQVDDVEVKGVANPYSFQIYSYNGTIYAQDQNGNIRFSGTKPSIVMQSALNNLTNGGSILVKKGIYSDNGWNLQIKYENITFMAEPGTTFNISRNNSIYRFIYVKVNNTIIDGFNINGSGVNVSALNGIYINNPEANITNVTIKNISANNIGISGTNAAISITEYNKIANYTYSNIKILDSNLTNNYRGITVSGTSQVSPYKRIYNLTIQNVSVYNSSDDGISIYSTQILNLTDVISNSNVRHGITISADYYNTNNLQAYNNNNSGVVVTLYATYGIMNNTMTKNNTWHGINIDTTLVDLSAADAYLTINGGISWNSRLYHGLYINGANYVTVDNLILRNNTDSGILTANSKNITIENSYANGNRKGLHIGRKTSDLIIRGNDLMGNYISIYNEAGINFTSENNRI